jgi:glycerol-3-phosphate O-acyltransferase
MTAPVTVPLWLFVLILLFAVITFASHFLFPSVRWFFRRRMERAVARLNQRLTRPIQPFKLAARHDTIQRLIYDPAVTEAVVEEARRDGIPEAVAFERARDYAREIVPSFSAFIYFSVGTRIARWLARSLYRVRVGAFDRDRLLQLDPDATVIFVMNHRSNMDYVLVTYLVAGAGALSYAVGEWARIWPLSWLIRAMGAYFIRRKSLGILYRRVLARYVQMATAAGVAQAVFPEGGLSLTGRMAPPRLGILSYIVEDWHPGARDVIFVPVALNYDRVIEDRFLISADKSGVRKFRPPVSTLVAKTLRFLALRLTGRFRPHGTATVSFGAPLSLAAFMADQRDNATEALATEVMDRVARAVPVLPVPLVCAILQADPGIARADITAQVRGALASLADAGIVLPRRTAEQVTDDGLALLTLRRLVQQDGDLFRPADGAADVIAYYAASIAHQFADRAGPPPPDAAP